MIQENRRRSRNFTREIDHKGDGRAKTCSETSETTKRRSQREAAPLSPPPRAGSTGKRQRETLEPNSQACWQKLEPRWACAQDGSQGVTEEQSAALVSPAPVRQSPSGAPYWLSPARGHEVPRPEDCGFDTLRV